MKVILYEMSGLHTIEDEREKTHSILFRSSTVVKHQIAKNRARTVGNFNCNGASLTSTATTSNVKFSVASTAEGKSVLSSLSLSLERKDSIQYMPRKVAPYTIPSGKSTVIHLDNCTHFMAQRVTTAKTAIKRTEFIRNGHNSNNASYPTTEPSSSTTLAAGVLDVDSKVILGVVDSSYHTNNKILNMNKQKLQDSKLPTPSRVRGRKNSLALDFKQPKELKIRMKKDIPDTSTPIKSVIKKPKRPARKKVVKPIQARKPNMKPKNEAEKVVSNQQIDKGQIDKSQNSCSTSSKSESKILQPCNYTLQSKKCSSEMTCPYLHSDFPCKYYYLNMPCPQDFKCQFMHNGPLESKLKEALRNHILDLLSAKPSAAEVHFVEQIHYIEDLSRRLQSFEVVKEKSLGIIEVMDDEAEDRVLVIDESSDEICTSNFADSSSTNSVSNISHDSDKIHTDHTIDKLDLVYEKFKEANFAVDEIDKKLQILKTKASITPKEKIHQLQVIYDLLKEQEKRLQIYENINANTTISVHENCKNEDPCIVLVNPNIVNDIQISESQEYLTNSNDEEKSKTMTEVACSQATNENTLCVVGTEFLSSEEENFINVSDDDNDLSAAENESLHPTNFNASKQINTEYLYSVNSNIDQNPNLNIENLPPVDSKIECEMTGFPKDCGVKNFNIPLNMNLEGESIHPDLAGKENCVSAGPKNHNIAISPTKLENKQSEHDSFPYIYESLEKSNCEIADKNNSESSVKNNSKIFDKNNSKICENIDLNNTLLKQNETLELEITNDEKLVVENDMKKICREEVEEQSPPYESISPFKREKQNRVRLRSQTIKHNEEKNLITTSPQQTKPIRTRRLRLPKSISKSVEKPNVDECQINADVINKLINSTDNNTENSGLLQDNGTPLGQNVILTKRFLKKAKAKLEQQSQLNEPQTTDCYTDISGTVQRNMVALHSNENKNFNRIENVDVSLLTQTSDDNSSSIPLQDPLVVEHDVDSTVDIPSCSEHFQKAQQAELSSSLKLSSEVEKNNTLRKQNLKRHISFINPSTTVVSPPLVDIKEKYHLGNPQIILAKLKAPHLFQTTQNDITQADSTTYVNSIVTSSFLADDNSAKKLRTFATENDLGSSLTDTTFSNSKSARKIKIDYRESMPLMRSNDSKDEDFESDSSDEKLTITSSYNSSQQQEDVEFSSTHQENHNYTHQRKEEPESESDLRQRIECISHKSDLQLQIQQQENQLFQQSEVEKNSKTSTSGFTAKNVNTLPPKQYKQQESIVEEKKNEKDLMYHTENKTKDLNIANTCDSYDNMGKDEDEQIQSLLCKRIYESEKLISNAGRKYSNETSATEEEINVKFSSYSTRFNKLTNQSTKCEINFEKSSVSITPISSPTYGNDTIASPSPTRNLIDFRMGGEIDGRLTYPPIPYILHEIAMGKTEVNKPIFVEKLKDKVHLDPRIFRTQKKSFPLCKPTDTNFNALVPITVPNNLNLLQDSSSFPQTTSMISPYDPRNRSTATVTNVPTPSYQHQSALTPYNSLQTAIVPSSSSSFMPTGIPNATPLALQYHGTSQPIIQPQEQQTPTVFLYGCLQRSSWYQNLMSNMKIQINQSISQLVRALNNFHRERIFNPEMVFDVFKIDCAGELLEIMRNLGIFVDTNGIIHEQRQAPALTARPCCNAVPVNATYSFIQQVLTPNTHCTSLTTASSTYSASGGANQVGQLNINEPFVSCYIKAPEPTQKHSDNCAIAHQSCDNENYNNKRNDNNSSSRFKKTYDNNDNYNNYQQRSNQRSSYNNNYNNKPRFVKPGSSSPSRSNTSPSSSPKKGFEGGNGGSYGGGRGGRGGGSRFNNNKRFNSYNNKDNNNSNDWSSSGFNDRRKNNKYQTSPPRSSSPNSFFKSGSPRVAETKASSPPPQKSNSTDEECWD